MALDIRENVPLAPLTTFGLGGPARWLTQVSEEPDVIEALGWAQAEEVPVLVVGGGSNLVISDEGFPGLVVRVVPRGVTFGDDLAFEEDGSPAGVLVTAAAGEPWDPFVEQCVARGLQGLECLSGIPGLVGAAPIQNVGAYGQEVSETVRTVRVVDRIDLGVRDLPAEQCGFGYRDSFFKQVPDRFVVLSVTFELHRDAHPAVRYAELQRALSGRPEPSLADVRREVIELRRAKSMVIDPDDPNRRSAGSFFTNPIVADAEAERVISRAVDEGIVADRAGVPRWPAGEGRTKLAAGWLIERAGVSKGTRKGSVGVSTRHCLALVNHGDGTTHELLELAREVRGRVQERWGISLAPEPTLVGCEL